jgi:hypothetical protein
LSHSTSPIFVEGFQDTVSQTICLGWLKTEILLISASSVLGLQACVTGAQLGNGFLKIIKDNFEKT